MVDSKTQRQQIKHSRMGSSSCYGRNADTHKLSDKAKEFSSKLPVPSISELIMHFNGDKYKTAYELTRQELGSTGTVEEYQKMYRNTLHDINRYLRKERTPNARMKERFRELYQPESKQGLKVHIKGCVNVSNTWYYKDATIRVPSHDVTDFIELAQDNINAAYAVLNGYYISQSKSRRQYSFDMTWLDNVEINMYF